MIGKLKSVVLMLVCLITVSHAHNDKQLVGIIHNVSLEQSPVKEPPVISTTDYRLVELDIKQLRRELTMSSANYSIKDEEFIIELPLPDGAMRLYQIKANQVLHPDLAVQFPQIKTFDGYAVDNEHELVKLDITPKGFHAMILSPGRSPIYIDPYNSKKPNFYMSYAKNNFITNKKMTCSVSQSSFLESDNKQHAALGIFQSCYLRTYRLALAATAQYTQFHGGTKVNALAAQATTINRVNGIYETEMAVTLQIIPNNADIIYTNSKKQPYTSGKAE
ncbi:MAG: hypothetical protein PSV35_05760, partial [bacterium]|nr:hypothetical protein [bacterium]